MQKSRNSIAVVWVMQTGGVIKGWWILAHTQISERISCIGQTAMRPFASANNRDPVRRSLSWGISGEPEEREATGGLLWGYAERGGLGLTLEGALCA